MRLLNQILGAARRSSTTSGRGSRSQPLRGTGRRNRSAATPASGGGIGSMIRGLGRRRGL